MSVSLEEQYRVFSKNPDLKPMEEIPVFQLPGIDSVLGQRLNEAGIVQAYQVLGKFLFLEKCHIPFYEWLRGFGADNGQCTACFNALYEWCDRCLDAYD